MPTPTAPAGSFDLAVVQFEGQLHCAYLNDYRIAGSKPWGGGVTAKSWKVRLKDVAHAVPAVQTAFNQREALRVAAQALYNAALANGQPENPALAQLLADAAKAPQI